jgi:hypothetical protein
MEVGITLGSVDGVDVVGFSVGEEVSPATLGK